MVPEVAFWGFWGLICIEKWSQNFDSGLQNASFGTPKMGKKHVGGTKNGPSGAQIKILRTLFNTN